MYISHPSLTGHPPYRSWAWVFFLQSLSFSAWWLLCLVPWLYAVSWVFIWFLCKSIVLTFSSRPERQQKLSNSKSSTFWNFKKKLRWKWVPQPLHRSFKPIQTLPYLYLNFYNVRSLRRQENLRTLALIDITSVIICFWSTFNHVC